MTSEEKQEIINEVLAALATNSKTIAQLTPVTELSESDLFEVAGGSRVTYQTLRSLIREGLALESQLSNYVTGDAAMMYLAKLDTETGTVDYKESPFVMLDGFKGVNGYTPVTGDLYYENWNGYQIWIKTQGGAQGVIANTNVAYANKNDGAIYRWTGSSMVRIGGSAVINDLVTGGEADALSAEMGVLIRQNVNLVSAKLDSLITALANLAFIGDRVDVLGQLNWNVVVPITHSVTANLTDCSIDDLPDTIGDGDTWTGTIEVETGYSLPLSIDVKMGGAAATFTYDSSTGEISIDNVFDNVVITAMAFADNNPVFKGVGYSPNTDTGNPSTNTAYLSVGNAQTRYCSPLIDLGASRLQAVSVGYCKGGIVMFDSSGIYNGALASSSSATTGSVPTTSRYIRLYGQLADIADGYVDVGGARVFDGSLIQSADIATADDFMASAYCPQPNANGDYVGWAFRFKDDFSNVPHSTSTASTDERRSINVCMCTKIGNGQGNAIGDYVIGKLIEMPSGGKLKYSVNEAIRDTDVSATAAGGSYLRVYTITNGVPQSCNFSGFESTNIDNNFVRNNSSAPFTRTHCRILCKKTTYESTSMYAFIANATNNHVEWIDPNYAGDIHDIIGAETT